jgi:hypothetical protein
MNYQYARRNYFKIDSDGFHKIKTQLRALGLIQLSEKNRGVRDTSTYWTLTNYGDQYLTKLMAIQKT